MSAAQVSRHESELGSWELVRRSPDPRLRAFVSDYEGYVESSSPAAVVRQQVPTTRLPLIVNFGSRWGAAGSPTESPTMHDSFVAGLFERSTYVGAAGPASCVQLNFTPLGATMLLGLRPSELVNRIAALDDVLPRGLRSIAAQLEGRTSWDERFELVDALLLARLARAHPPPTDVAWAWRALEQTHGKAPIGWICDRLGRSRRHLAARFREQTGLNPKTVARVMRFDRAVSLLGQQGAQLADVAFECGYYDQAHLNRDFREFADASPGAFARRIVPDGGVLA